jgi:hypothetical protein
MMSEETMMSEEKDDAKGKGCDVKGKDDARKNG